MSLEALNHSASFSGRRHARGGRLAPGILAGIKTVAAWRSRSKQRLALLTLDDRLLSDIGLNRAQAEAEARKPFWKV